MRISDLRHFEQLTKETRVRVVRHRVTPEAELLLAQPDGFKKWQEVQALRERPVFGDASVLISFVAERHKYARFMGVWDVLGGQAEKTIYRYRTREREGFDDLKGRLIVAWGDSTRAWVQRLDTKGDKEVVEITPRGSIKECPGYYDFTLTLAELTDMIRHEDANRQWKRMLSAVSGIYLILDTTTGLQYVGSAYGQGGIWGRWASYVRSGHGGNVGLRQLLGVDAGRSVGFQFSILRVLEPHATRDEVLEQESIVKRKLGSRAHGLNHNGRSTGARVCGTTTGLRCSVQRK